MNTSILDALDPVRPLGHRLPAGPRRRGLEAFAAELARGVQLGQLDAATVADLAESMGLEWLPSVRPVLARSVLDEDTRKRVRSPRGFVLFGEWFSGRIGAGGVVDELRWELHALRVKPYGGRRAWAVALVLRRMNVVDPNPAWESIPTLRGATPAESSETALFAWWGPDRVAWPVLPARNGSSWTRSGAAAEPVTVDAPSGYYIVTRAKAPALFPAVSADPPLSEVLRRVCAALVARSRVRWAGVDATWGTPSFSGVAVDIQAARLLRVLHGQRHIWKCPTPGEGGGRPRFCVFTGFAHSDSRVTLTSEVR